MTCWLSIARVCEVTGWTDRWVRNKATAGEIVSRDSAEMGRNGRPLKEYAADSLPESARATLRKGVEPQPARTTVTSLALLAPSAPQNQKQRIALNPEAKAVAEARLAVIQPLLDYIDSPTCRPSFAPLQLADGTAITSSDLLARYLAETRICNGKQVSRATLWAWAKAYRQDGLFGLAPAIRSDKGQSRWFARNPRAAQLVAAVYLAPFASAQSAYDSLQRECSLLNLQPQELPSYSTVRAYLDTIPRPISVLAREGERAHSERMSLYVKRGYIDVAPNQIWVSDHAIHDVYTYNDIFPSEQEGRIMRLRLTMLLDMRSRKPVGYSWTPEGSSKSITSALRRAITAYGPCEQFYCDNGKDFQKVARGSAMAGLSDTDIQALDLELSEIERMGILARLGIPTQHCIKYHPQSKHIERFFRTMHLQFDAKFAAYTTGNAYTRTDSANVLSIEHRRLQKLGLHRETKLMPASVFIQMCAMWMEEVYSNAPHRGEGMDGLSPNQIFDAGYPANQRRVADLARIEELFWERKAVRVREAAVTLHKRRFMGISAADSNQLYLANESQVFIQYDSNDLDRAVITDLDGHKLASVQAERLTTQSAEANPQIAESMQLRRHQRNASMDAIRGLRRTVHDMGHQTDLQEFYDRALPGAVGDLITQRVPQTAKAETLPDHQKHLHSEDIGDALAARLQRRTANGTLG
jgi:putative transposase